MGDGDVISQGELDRQLLVASVQTYQVIVMNFGIYTRRWVTPLTGRNKFDTFCIVVCCSTLWIFYGRQRAFTGGKERAIRHIR